MKDKRAKLRDDLIAENIQLLEDNKLLKLELEILKRKFKLYEDAIIITDKETGTDEYLLNNIEKEFFSGSFSLK